MIGVNSMTPAALLALAMTCSPSVHPDTAHDIAKAESGLNPLAIAEIIPKSERLPSGKSFITHLPKSKGEALNIVNNIENKKRRYSVGLMQITNSNFKNFGTTAEKLFSPCENLSVFEKIITDCYLRGGSLKRALSCYYSGNFDTGQKSEVEFSTSYVQRIGYVVPSTKQDKAVNQEIATPIPNPNPNPNPKPRIVYPSHVVRGEFVLTSNGE